MESRRMHRLGREAIHTSWDNALPPRLIVEPGDTVVFETLEPSSGHGRPQSRGWNMAGARC